MKLIRNNYINLINKERLYKINTNDEVLKYNMLVKKLKEELQELESSNFEDPLEYADVLEVLDSLLYFKKINKKEVLNLKENKKEKYGDFSDFLILKEEI